MQNEISLCAPAKVNLRLEVLGKRANGYHELRTWIYPISLGDELHIKRLASSKIVLSCFHSELPLGEENLAYRAATLFLKETGLSVGVKIEITKRIPVAAGLGGGSSDAAAVLKGMNVLLGAKVSQKELMEMGERIGADVPFFILGKGAMMGGKGERLLQLLPPLELWMVLVNPGRPLYTQKVYQKVKEGLTKNRRDNKILMFPQDLEKMGNFLCNDLEAVALELMPVIEVIKKRLCEVGAIAALMTGSGPTVFGLFPGQQEANRAAKEMKMEEGWISFVAHTTSDL